MSHHCLHLATPLSTTAMPSLPPPYALGVEQRCRHAYLARTPPRPPPCPSTWSNRDATDDTVSSPLTISSHLSRNRDDIIMNGCPPESIGADQHAGALLPDADGEGSDSLFYQAWMARATATSSLDVDGEGGDQWRAREKSKGVQANSFSPLFVLFLVIFVSCVHKFSL
jgi:hypothetical protein